MTVETRQESRRVLVHDLGEADWELVHAASGDRWPAQVPGSVHADLLRAEAIPDPFYRENETLLSWIGEREWQYTSRFALDPEFLCRDRQLLSFLGLDTLATVVLNGTEVLRADNMHRTWELDVTGLLRADNSMVVTFASPLTEIRRRQAERPLPGWYTMMCIDGTGWLRKELANFGWDWGPALVTAGIWRGANLTAYDDVRVTGLAISQEHQAGAVELLVDAELSADLPPGHALRTRLVGPDGDVVADERHTTNGVVLTVREPSLWWPNGLGSQPFYELDVQLIGADGVVLDSTRRRIGLRTLVLVREPDEHGESFRFECNGVPFFAKGANWIPADAVIGRTTDATVRERLADAAGAHMNMLRVWGGGFYESDDFYDACDELGICVWQDVAFACATFPGFDQAYLENVVAEVVDNARRLRHHPSLALWCGNNELELGLVGDNWNEHHMSWADYEPLMDRLLPDALADHDPGRSYWPASPHSPGNRKDADDPSRGDAHLWKVWHGGEHPSWYRSSRHRFISEFGFQSFPHPATVEGFTEPSDRDLASPVMDLHQKAMAAGANGSAELARQLVQSFRTPRGWDELVWQTQLLQAHAVVTGVEHWRRNMPETMGTLYWQLNDCWPGASWSSIDSDGRWKALHYAIRRAYAPTMLSLVENVAEGTVSAYVSNDLREVVDTEILWTVTTCDGDPVDSGTLTFTVPAQSSGCAGVIDVSAALAAHGARNTLVWAQLVGDDEQSTLATFAPPKHLALRDPGLRIDVEGDEVTLAVERPALWVWVDAPGASDNFFHMPPGKRVITVPGAVEGLVARSLLDTSG
ncbi:MAG: glycoside hydrolase family 2 protein [Mycobacteriales bacterium]